MAAKATYKRLGDYIRLVDVHNRDLKVDKLMGINVDKFFMPSVANVIGTDLSDHVELSELLKQESKQGVHKFFLIRNIKLNNTTIITN